MRMLELNVILDVGTPSVKQRVMAFNIDDVSYIGVSKSDKNRSWIRLRRGTFIEVVHPYKDLLSALRNDTGRLT